MPLGKSFFNGRSKLTHAQRHLGAEAAPASRVHVLRLSDQMRGAGAAQAPDATSECVPSSRGLRAILAAGFARISRAATRCAVCAELAFTNLPVAVLSWLMTQFFVGCAAYAEAMYPSVGHMSGSEALHRIDPTESEPAENDHVSPSPQLAPDLKELSGFAIDAEERHSPSGGGNIVWLNVTPKTSSRRLVSTALLITRWFAKRRGSAHTRPVTIELRNYDRRTLRGAAMPRYGTE